jgi:hypothetical protein
VWKLGDVGRARRSRTTQEEIGADTLLFFGALLVHSSLQMG